MPEVKSVTCQFRNQLLLHRAFVNVSWNPVIWVSLPGSLCATVWTQPTLWIVAAGSACVMSVCTATWHRYSMRHCVGLSLDRMLPGLRTRTLSLVDTTSPLGYVSVCVCCYCVGRLSTLDATTWLRVSTTTRNLLEFEIPSGSTGSLLKFNWSSWKFCC